ncbi:MAG: DinB family protein [Daejeonella sp.]
MNLIEYLVTELEEEGAKTRKMLMLVPFENVAWKPHVKSMSIGHLSAHIAEIPSWINITIDTPELDFATMNYTAPKISSNTELIAFFDSTLQKAVDQLKVTSEETLEDPWTLRNGEHIFINLPKRQVIRTLVLNHIIHHRAQLSVFLRLLDIPLPGIYGPTADDKN